MVSSSHQLQRNVSKYSAAHIDTPCGSNGSHIALQSGVKTGHVGLVLAINVAPHHSLANVAQRPARAAERLERSVVVDLLEYVQPQLARKASWDNLRRLLGDAAVAA